MTPVWRIFWRVIGVLAVLTSSLCCFFLWGLWKATSLKPSIAGNAVAIDGISLQIDILSLTLAAVGVSLGVIGLFGYQSLKEAAEARAELIATRRADAVATEAVAKHIENIGNSDGLRGANQPATVGDADVTPV